MPEQRDLGEMTGSVEDEKQPENRVMQLMRTLCSQASWTIVGEHALADPKATRNEMLVGIRYIRKQLRNLAIELEKDK